MAIQIFGNKIIDCDGGIKVVGATKADIQKNYIYKTRVGVEVDENFSGTIADNAINEASQHAILVNKIDPYVLFGIPSAINKDELYKLFKKLDEADTTHHEAIIKDSTLSRVDQFTSITERLVNFSKEYGPMLITNFAPFLTN